MNILEAISVIGLGRVVEKSDIEDLMDQCREATNCLILGMFRFEEQTNIHLEKVCSYFSSLDKLLWQNRINYSIENNLMESLYIDINMLISLSTEEAYYTPTELAELNPLLEEWSKFYSDEIISCFECQKMDRKSIALPTHILENRFHDQQWRECCQNHCPYIICNSCFAKKKYSVINDDHDHTLPISCSNCNHIYCAIHAPDSLKQKQDPNCGCYRFDEQSYFLTHLLPIDQSTNDDQDIQEENEIDIIN